MTEYDTIYLRKTGASLPVNWRLGGFASEDDIDHAFEFLQMRFVPDIDHKSSLDYLNGV